MAYKKITKHVLQRYEGNPVLTADDFPCLMRAVYNSSAIKTGDGRYVMLCRTNELNHRTLLWGADSPDGFNWTLRPEPFVMPDTALWNKYAASVYYDPRITYLDGEYKVLLACQGPGGTRVAMFRSDDLQSLEYVNYINAPDNRNMVIFPEKSRDGRYMRLERPNLAAAGGKGNIWLSFSPDLIHWGDSLEIIESHDLWNYAYGGLGPSTVPIRIEQGWLIFFHAIMNNCTSREYSMGAAILDGEEPWKVQSITKYPILYPEANYEMTGLVEHVVFPCSAILEDDGLVKIYYGGADTVQCVATGQLADIVHACENW